MLRARPMPARLKKLIGTFALLAWIAVYALVAANLGATVLPDAHWAVEFLYYLFAGLAWIVPAGFLIQWMSEEPRR